MIDLWNLVVASVCAFFLGLAVHSVYLHAKKRGEVNRKLPWDHGEEDEE